MPCAQHRVPVRREHAVERLVRAAGATPCGRPAGRPCRPSGQGRSAAGPRAARLPRRARGAPAGCRRAPQRVRTHAPRRFPGSGPRAASLFGADPVRRSTGFALRAGAHTLASYRTASSAALSHVPVDGQDDVNRGRRALDVRVEILEKPLGVSRAARAGRRGRSRRLPRGTRSRRPSATPRGRQTSARARARSCGRPSA